MNTNYLVMPPLSDAEFAELKADIVDRGIMVPIEYDEEGQILDGHHRVKACLELGITDWPRIVRLGFPAMCLRRLGAMAARSPFSRRSAAQTCVKVLYTRMYAGVTAQ